MNRCASRRAVLAGWCRMGGLLAPLILAAGGVSAQVHRNFPANALRGELQLVSSTEVLLNGVPARLAPGARLRGQNNMLVMSAAAIGPLLVVNYTLDQRANVKDVWILREEEIAKRPWPRTPLEAKTWFFNFDAQTWVVP